MDRDPSDIQPVVLLHIFCLLRAAEEALWQYEEKAQICVAQAAALLKISQAIKPDSSLALPGASPRLAPWEMARIEGYIDAHLGEKITLARLAEVIRISASHFSRKFRSTLDETPYAFLLRRRINRAQDLIRDTDWPLSQIALDCGLTDQAHLSKLFRRIVGISPSAWRRLQKDPPTRCSRAVQIGNVLHIE